MAAFCDRRHCGQDSLNMTTSRCQSAGLIKRRRRALAVGASVVAAALLVTPAARAAVKAGGALPAWPASPDWQQYVEAPGSLNLSPVRVVSVSGTVTNPGGIVAGGHGASSWSSSTSSALKDSSAWSLVRSPIALPPHRRGIS
jgi:hypothetical protein